MSISTEPPLPEGAGTSPASPLRTAVPEALAAQLRAAVLATLSGYLSPAAGDGDDGSEPAQLLDQMRAWQVLSGFCQAQSLLTAAAFADTCRTEPGLVAGEQTAQTEVGWVFGGDGWTGQHRLDLARGLDPRTTPIPQLAARAHSGLLPVHYVSAVLETVRDFPTPAVEFVEAAMLRTFDRHLGRTRSGVPIPPQWRSWRDTLRRAAMRVRPDEASLARAERVRDRAAWIRHHRDGTATIACTLPAVDAAGVWETLTAAAEQVRSDDGVAGRTLDQARVDAFSALFADVARAGHRDPDSLLPRLRTSMPVTIAIRTDLATLLGLRDNPGELPGAGPIDPELVRILAEDAVWQRLIHDPITGDLLDAGATVRRPGERLRRFVAARHPHCTRPGCTRPARHSQLDHIEPWPSGQTTRENLHPACQRDHNRKTHEGWRTERLADGRIEWTSPHGLRSAIAEPPWLDDIEHPAPSPSAPAEDPPFSDPPF